MELSFKKKSNRTAVITDSGEKISYLQMDHDMESLYKAIGKRCLVFCLCTNTYACLVGYLTFLHNKIVPLMLDANLDADLLSNLFEKYCPKFIWAPDKLESTVVQKGEKVFSMQGYSLYSTCADIEHSLYSELALLLTTSGSTGSPKLVRQSYENISANTRSIIEYLEMDENEVAITTLPMNYTYGLSIINTHIYVGACIVLTGKTLMQKDFWELFSRYGVTSFGGVPYIYEMLERLRFREMNLPILKTMTQAGGKLSSELHKKFAQYALENGKRFVVMYGQTEATARMAYLPYKESLRKYGSMGIAIPGGEFSLIDTYGNIIDKPNINGELVYKGSNVALGYAECGEDLIKGNEWNGLLRTGDVAKRDSEGFYYIVGRLKRFLKLYGSRINLDETELLINTNFPGINCVCGGIDDKMYIFSENNVDFEELLHFLCEKTSFSRSAFRLVKINKIPRNESGKVKYSELEKYYF